MHEPATDPGWRVLSGHRWQVRALAAAGSAPLLLTGGRDGPDLRLWQLEEGRSLARLQITELVAEQLGLDEVRQLVVTPDWTQVAALCLGGRILRWQPETGQPLEVLVLPELLPVALGFGTEGRLWIRTRRGGIIHRHDPQHAEELGTIAVEGPVASDAGGVEGSLLLGWDLVASARPMVHRCPLPAGPLAVSPDGQLASCGAGSGGVAGAPLVVIHLESGEVRPVHAAPLGCVVRNLQWGADGRLLVALQEDGGSLLLQGELGPDGAGELTWLPPLPLLGRSIEVMAADPSGPWLIVGEGEAEEPAAEGRLSLIDLQQRQLLGHLELPWPYLHGLAISASGWLVACGPDPLVRVRPLGSLATAVCAAPASHRWAAGGVATQVLQLTTVAGCRWGIVQVAPDQARLLELVTGQLESPDLPCEVGAAMALSPDGTQLLVQLRRATAAGGTEIEPRVRLYELATGYCLTVLKLPDPAPLAGLAFSSDGRYGLTVGDDARLRIWDLEGGRCERVLAGHTTALARLEVAGGRAMTLDRDGNCRVWHLAEGPAAACCVAYLPVEWLGWGSRPRLAPDGRSLVWIDGDSIQLFVIEEDFPEFAPLADELLLARSRSVPLGPHDGVRTLAFDPAGRRLVTAGFQDVRCWNLAERRLEQTLAEDQAGGLLWLGEGRWLACWEPTGSALRLWDLATGDCVGRFERGKPIGCLTAWGPRSLVGGAEIRELFGLELMGELA